MGRIWLACLGLAGCQQFLGLDAPVLAPDASPADSNQVCIGSGLVSFCVTSGAVPTNAFDIAPGASLTIDPTVATLCLRTQLAGVEACVIPAQTASIAGTLEAVGPYPIVIAVFDVITINGTLDVSSTSPTMGGGIGTAIAGAGSGPASCPSLDGASSLLVGGSGGGGGSFGSSGGIGGPSSNGTLGGAAGALGTIALAGGCPGGKGGSGNDGPVGRSGLGGGVIYIIAGGSITVNGTIKANGGGGGGGGKRAGGGGGGAGGLIGFDAPEVTLTASAAIYANGGGGAEGGDNNIEGESGGVSAGPLDRALGGGGASDAGGSGGAGSLDTSPGMPGMGPKDTTSGGGGGGGGGGVIAIYSHVVSNNAVMSPPPQLP